MKVALGELMTVFILIVYLFQPAVSELYATKSYAVEMILDRAVEEAAVKGYFTQEIIDSMKSDLINHLDYEDTEIEIIATTTLRYRGEYIEATVKVPKGPMFILPNTFGPDDSNKYLVKYAKQMSEYKP